MALYGGDVRGILEVINDDEQTYFNMKGEYGTEIRATTFNACSPNETRNPETEEQTNFFKNPKSIVSRRKSCENWGKLRHVKREFQVAVQEEHENTCCKGGGRNLKATCFCSDNIR